jgi:repressor LexA
MTDKLTQTQRKVFDFLSQYLQDKGYPPTLREIACHFGLKGPKAPQKTLQILEKKGFIRRSPGESRAIEILGVKEGRGSAFPIEMDRRVGHPSNRPGMPGSLPYEILSIPIVGQVRAGEPLLAIENIEGYLHLDRSLASSRDVFLLRVQGDSMIDAHIQDGDFALVKPQPHAENGEIVVALIDDEATIKRIFKQRDLIRLEPANPAMAPIVVKKGEKRVTLVGKVVGIFRKL